MTRREGDHEGDVRRGGKRGNRDPPPISRLKEGSEKERKKKKKKEGFSSLHIMGQGKGTQKITH